MNKTPRTDAQLKLEASFDGIGIVKTVEVEFARELEEELIEARADAEHWKSECNALQRMVHEARAEIEQMKCCGNCADNHTTKSKKVCKTCVRGLYGTKQSDNWSRKAALAAERGEK